MRGKAGQMSEARQGRCASKVRQKRESRPVICRSKGRENARDKAGHVLEARQG
jgi:hypothetical protein